MDQISSYRQKKRAAVILAGGEGSRPRALTRKIPGRNIPKQFYAFFGTETLVERTLRRVALGIEPRLTSVVVTGAHDRLYMSILAGMPPDNVVVQPQNRGSAQAWCFRTAPHGSRGRANPEIKAEFENGFIEVTAPLTKEAGAKAIAIVEVK